MPDNVIFQLKRHENILSSLVRYLAGHTSDITDFSEGSITRSLLEGVSQEIYRQNVTYAQGITTGLPAAIRSAFNLPLLDATKASGQFTAYRQMLQPPTLSSVSYTNPATTISGSISGITLTISAKTLGTPLAGMAVTGAGILPGTYLSQYIAEAASPNIETWYVGPGAAFTGSASNNILTVDSITYGQISVGMSINNSSLSLAACTVLHFLSGTGGVGTYYVSSAISVSSGSTLFANPQTVAASTIMTLYGRHSAITSPAATLLAGTGLTAGNTYYYSMVPVYGDFSTGFTEGLGTAPVSLSSNAVSSATITWQPVNGSSGIRLYRSTSAAMQNAQYMFLPNNTSVIFANQVYDNSYTESSFAGTNATFTWSVTSGAVSAIAVSAAGTGYSAGDVFHLSGYGNNNCVFIAATVNGSGGILTTSIMHPGSGYSAQASGVSAAYISYISNKWPGTRYTYAVSALNQTNGAAAETTISAQNVASSGSVASLSWTATSAIDATCNPTGYKIYKADFDTSAAQITGLSGQLNASTSSLNYGASATYAAVVGRTLIVSPTMITSGTLLSDQQLSASAGLSSGTNIVAPLSGTSNTPQKWLLNIPQTTTNTGSGATMTWTVSSGSVSAVTIVNGGSNYVVGDVIVLTGGNSDAVIRVNGAAGVTSGALVAGTYTATTAGTSGSGATFTWTVTGGAITAITIPAGGGGSGYAVNDIIIINGYGNNLAYIKVIASGGLSGSSLVAGTYTSSSTNIQIISGGSGYSAQSSPVSVTNPLTIQIISAGTGYSAQASATTGTLGVAVNDLLAITSYYYKVAGLLSGSETQSSDSFSITPSKFYPGVYLTWQPITGAVSYRIYRATNKNFMNAVFYDTTSPYFSDDGTTLTSSNKLTSSIPAPSLLASTSPTALGFVDAGSLGSKQQWLVYPSAFSKAGPIVIPAGTRVGSENNSVTYKYVSGTTLLSGDKTATSIIQCEQYGIVGNIGPELINTFITPIYGISKGVNLQSFINGTDVETDDEWRSRFSQNLQKNARGTSDAIVAGALGTRLYDDNGFILESVIKALLVETSAGNLSLYIHNGRTSGVSSDLIMATQKIIDGYTLPNGQKIAGYKAAGIPVVVAAALTQLQNVSVAVRVRPGMSLPVMQDNIYSKIYEYFNTLDISDGLYIPTITSLVSNTTSQNVEYRYQIIAVDSNGNKSAPSSTKTITTGNSTINNTLVWTVYSGGPTISYYDILRWTGSSWGLVATIPTSAPYYNSSTNQMTYTDTIPVTISYVAINYNNKYLKKNELTDYLLNIPNLLTLSVTLPTNSLADQEYVQAPRTYLLTPGVIYVT